jgi:hypothetical protein
LQNNSVLTLHSPSEGPNESLLYNQSIMRQILFGLFLICALFANSQKLVKNEVDKFTKAQRLQTSNVRLKSGMLFYIRTYTTPENGTNYYITFFGSTPSPDVVGTEDKLTFLLENDSTVNIYPTDIQGTEYTAGVSMYRHQYELTESDIKALAENDVKSIRMYASRGYNDIDLRGDKEDEIKKAARLILKELK